MRARRLEATLGSPPIYVKRDDLTGFALGGNKARKLEFLLGDAIDQGCDLILTGGGPGSNHIQATAAAARVAGMTCELILYGDRPALPHPNLRLARFFGANLHYTGDAERSSVDRAVMEWTQRLALDGRKPYAIPRGGATAVGAVGYALAVHELAIQLEREGTEIEMLVVATGSCGTQAGILSGASLYDWKVIGASVSRPIPECRERVLRLARECSALLHTPPPGEGDVDVRDMRGPGYGELSTEAAAAAELGAWTEGLLLDPVYTAKAFALLVSLARRATGPIVFWHTGGMVSAVHGWRNVEL